MTLTSTVPLSAAPTYDCRKVFAEELIALAHADERIVVVCNDSVGSSNLGGFRDAFPDRLVNVGIAEQAMVGVAAGLANGGMIPVVSAASPFLTGRALEQIKADVAYSRLKVVLCGQSPGVSYGALGPTHHSIEDLSWLRAVADLPVVVPADPEETRAVLRWAVAADGPSFLRVGRYGVPAVTPADTPFVPGKALTLRDGADATIVAAGVPVSRALVAAETLAAEGIDVRVVDMASVDPIDEQAVLDAAATGAVVTAEEATTTGGLGAAIATFLAERRPTPMRILGVPGVFAPTGDTDFLLDHFGLTAARMADAVRELVRGR